jgi:hypothetical protein
MPDAPYHYIVCEDNAGHLEPGQKRFKNFETRVVADAMAVFSAAIAEGKTEYITIEALRDRP